MSLRVLLFVLIALTHLPEGASAQVCPSPAFCVPETRETRTNRAERDASKSAAAEQLALIKRYSYLPPDVVKNHQNNLQRLVGTYYIIKSDKTLEEIGNGDFEAKDTKIELKDDVGFRGVVTKNWKAEASFLPFIGLKLGDKQVAELTIQDIVTVGLNDLPKDTINCGFPSTEPVDPKAQYIFVTAATTTAMTFRKFDEGEVSGKGAIMMVSFDGSSYTSNEEISKQKAIWISKVRVSPITDSKVRAEKCKPPKPEKAEKKCEQQVAFAPPVTPLGIGVAKATSSFLNEDIPELDGGINGLALKVRKP